MPETPQPVLLDPTAGEGETVVDQPRRTLRILFGTNSSMPRGRVTKAGSAAPSRTSTIEHTDAFYVLEGELTFRIGPDLDRVTATAGTFVAVPPNVVHGFDNDSSERCASSTSTRRAAASPTTCAA